MLLVTSSVGIILRSIADFDNWEDNVIGPQGLLATKARILVTNGIAFIKQFDNLVFIRRGIILECGPYESLLADANGEIIRLM